ncbi:MAG TPA: NmrA/HSCARG family protein [Kofleriaceae bacterium]|nr:NmrA/HSCARG family protein [Kofleriaceae bacterium]
MSSSRLVLVAGATGRQGGAVVDALLRRGHRVRALTRRPGGAEAARLRARGVEIAAAGAADRGDQGDRGDRGDADRADRCAGALLRAARGVDAFFAVTAPDPRGAEQGAGRAAREIERGIAQIDAAVAARVPHLVLSTIASADRATGIPTFEAKLAVERRARASGVPLTIIAPVLFMENLIAPACAADLSQGRISLPLPAARSLQHIAVADIGGFAASMIERGDAVVGRRFDIAGDELTGEQAACILSDVIGRRIRYRARPPALAADRDEDAARMFEWLDRTGHEAAIEDLRDDFPEVGWHDFETWARRQDWSALDRGGGIHAAPAPPA